MCASVLGHERIGSGGSRSHRFAIFFGSLNWRGAPEAGGVPSQRPRSTGAPAHGSRWRRRRRSRSVSGRAASSCGPCTPPSSSCAVYCVFTPPSGSRVGGGGGGCGRRSSLRTRVEKVRPRSRIRYGPVGTWLTATDLCWTAAGRGRGMSLASFRALYGKDGPRRVSTGGRHVSRREQGCCPALDRASL